jgi:hypothetical protein
MPKEAITNSRQNPGDKREVPAVKCSTSPRRPGHPSLKIGLPRRLRLKRDTLPNQKLTRNTILDSMLRHKTGRIRCIPWRVHLFPPLLEQDSKLGRGNCEAGFRDGTKEGPDAGQ